MQVELDIPGMPHPLYLCVHKENDTCVSRQILEHRIWEPYETSLIVKYLKKNDVFLDIGANIGYYSVIAATIVGKQGKVLAFEPDSHNFSLLKENIEINGLTNVEAFNAAISDFSGKGHIYLSEDNKGDHHIYDCGKGRKKVEIDIINGEEQVAKVTRHLDFIKIDTQGSEVHILRGLENMIHENRDHLSMIIEFWPYGLRQSGTSGSELLKKITRFRMPIFIIDHIGHCLMPITVDGLQKWVDDTDADPSNQGFINLFLTTHPSGDSL